MKHFKGNPKSLKKMGQLSNSLPFAKDMMR